MSVLSPPWPPASTSIKWGLDSNAAMFRSPINKVVQSIARQGSVWHAVNELALMEEDRARAWEAFFFKAQDGGYSFYWNRYPFNIYPKHYPSGTGWGTPLVNGTSQTGKSLIIDGFTAGGILSAGDFLAFDNDRYRELHMLDADATADGSGHITVVLTPAIRRSPADDASIFLDGATATAANRCAGEFILAAPFNPGDVGEVSVGYQFECFEKLDAST